MIVMVARYWQLNLTARCEQSARPRTIVCRQVRGARDRMFPVQNMFFPFFFDASAIVFVGIWFLMRLTQGTGELLTA